MLFIRRCKATADHSLTYTVTTFAQQFIPIENQWSETSKSLLLAVRHCHANRAPRGVTRLPALLSLLSFPFISFPFLSRSRLICSISAGKMTPSIGKMSTPSSPTFAGANLIHLHCRPLHPLHPLHPLRRLPSRGHWRRHNRPIKDAFVRIRLPTLVYYSCLSADSGTPTG